METGGDTTVSVNADGLDSDFVVIATLQFLTGAVLTELLVDGNLLLT